MAGIPVRCSRCHRVRLGGYGSDWEDRPGKLKGEVDGFCATCGELLKRLSDERRAREGRALLRQRERGFWPALEGVDVFENFREPITESEKEKPMPVPETYKPSDTKAESNNLRAEDFPIDTKWTLKITDVNMELMEAREKGKSARNRLVLSFDGKKKRLVLNATNQGFIEARLGDKPNGWIGADIVLHRTTTTLGNDTVPAFRVIEARKGPAPQREPGSDEF